MSANDNDLVIRVTVQDDTEGSLSQIQRRIERTTGARQAPYRDPVTGRYSRRPPTRVASYQEAREQQQVWMGQVAVRERQRAQAAWRRQQAEQRRAFEQQRKMDADAAAERRRDAVSQGRSQRLSQRHAYTQWWQAALVQREQEYAFRHARPLANLRETEEFITRRQETQRRLQERNQQRMAVARQAHLEQTRAGGYYRFIAREELGVKAQSRAGRLYAALAMAEESATGKEPEVERVVERARDVIRGGRAAEGAAALMGRGADATDARLAARELLAAGTELRKSADSQAKAAAREQRSQQLAQRKLELVGAGQGSLGQRLYQAVYGRFGTETKSVIKRMAGSKEQAASYAAMLGMQGASAEQLQEAATMVQGGMGWGKPPKAPKTRPQRVMQYIDWRMLRWISGVAWYTAVLGTARAWWLVGVNMVAANEKGLKFQKTEEAIARQATVISQSIAKMVFPGLEAGVGAFAAVVTGPTASIAAAKLNRKEQAKKVWEALEGMSPAERKRWGIPEEVTPGEEPWKYTIPQELSSFRRFRAGQQWRRLRHETGRQMMSYYLDHPEAMPVERSPLETAQARVTWASASYKATHGAISLATAQESAAAAIKAYTDQINITGDVVKKYKMMQERQALQLESQQMAYEAGGGREAYFHGRQAEIYESERAIGGAGAFEARRRMKAELRQELADMDKGLVALAKVGGKNTEAYARALIARNRVAAQLRPTPEEFHRESGGLMQEQLARAGIGEGWLGKLTGISRGYQMPFTARTTPPVSTLYVEFSNMTEEGKRELFQQMMLWLAAQTNSF